MVGSLAFLFIAVFFITSSLSISSHTHNSFHSPPFATPIMRKRFSVPLRFESRRPKL